MIRSLSLGEDTINSLEQIRTRNIRYHRYISKRRKNLVVTTNAISPGIDEHRISKQIEEKIRCRRGCNEKILAVLENYAVNYRIKTV